MSHCKICKSITFCKEKSMYVWSFFKLSMTDTQIKRVSPLCLHLSSITQFFIVDHPPKRPPMKWAFFHGCTRNLVLAIGDLSKSGHKNANLTTSNCDLVDPITLHPSLYILYAFTPGFNNIFPSNVFRYR